MIDGAGVEHESLQGFIDQLLTMGPDDEKYAARIESWVRSDAAGT